MESSEDKLFPLLSGRKWMSFWESLTRRHRLDPEDLQILNFMEIFLVVSYLLPSKHYHITSANSKSFVWSNAT